VLQCTGVAPEQAAAADVTLCIAASMPDEKLREKGEPSIFSGDPEVSAKSIGTV
jgi:hypothetical protein